MTPLGDMVQPGGPASLLFIPGAVLLGALHGLEPGHSKTMMAAFIIAVRGTVAQAILLGIAATLSHTAIVWVVALGGLSLFNGVNAEAAEPYFQVASAALIILIALWMLRRTRREQRHHHHDLTTGGQEDAHALEHANEIKRRFANRRVTTGQIVMFGLSGGLIPCPAAITVLLLCLQAKQLLLGAAIVMAFSIGLALTMVAAGVAAASSVQQIARRWSGFGDIAVRAPYLSGAIIVAMGGYLGYTGLHALAIAGAV